MRSLGIATALCLFGCTGQDPRETEDSPASLQAAYTVAYRQLLESARNASPQAPFLCLGMPGQPEPPIDFVSLFADEHPQVRPLAACLRPEWACSDVPDQRDRPIYVYLGPPRLTESNETIEFPAYRATSCHWERYHTGVSLRRQGGEWRAAPVLAWFT